MSSTFDFDGQPVPLQPGDTILQAAQRAGHEVPRLCWHEGVSASASCRLCSVVADGRPVAACATPADFCAPSPAPPSRCWPWPSRP